MHALHVLGTFDMHFQRFHAQRQGACTRLQGEAFSMRSPVPVAGAVEVWMGAVEGEMRGAAARARHT